MEQLKASFNRIKNPRIVVGANGSRFAPLSIVGDNEPIYSDPTNKVGLPLQFEPKHLYHGARGIPVVFAFQGKLSNVDPLSDVNDDVELAQAAQTTEKFIQVEVERRYSKDNPFQKLTTLIMIHGAVMIMGFIIVAVLLMNIQTVANAVGEQIGKYAPIAEKILANPEQFGIPPNLIGVNPTTPPPANPGITGGIIPGV